MLFLCLFVSVFVCLLFGWNIILSSIGISQFCYLMCERWICFIYVCCYEGAVVFVTKASIDTSVKVWVVHGFFVRSFVRHSSNGDRILLIVDLSNEFVLLYKYNLQYHIHHSYRLMNDHTIQSHVNQYQIHQIKWTIINI